MALKYFVITLIILSTEVLAVVVPLAIYEPFKNYLMAFAVLCIVSMFGAFSILLFGIDLVKRYGDPQSLNELVIDDSMKDLKIPNSDNLQERLEEVLGCKAKDYPMATIDAELNNPTEVSDGM